MIDLSLESLPKHQRATVAQIDWARLATPEARRLRELGFDEGVSVEVLHRAPGKQASLLAHRSTTFCHRYVEPLCRMLHRFVL